MVFLHLRQETDTALTIHTQQSINIKLRACFAIKIKGFIQQQFYRLNGRLKALRIILLILRFDIVVSGSSPTPLYRPGRETQNI